LMTGRLRDCYSICLIFADCKITVGERGMGGQGEKKWPVEEKEEERPQDAPRAAGFGPVESIQV
jgi:hypothetical protein